jgi:prophage tail gpP-like protein
MNEVENINMQPLFIAMATGGVVFVDSYSFSSHYDSFCTTFTFVVTEENVDASTDENVKMIDIKVGDLFTAAIKAEEGYSWIKTNSSNTASFVANYKYIDVFIIEKKMVNLSKTGLTITFSGKDIGSKLVEGYINTAKDYNNVAPMDIIAELVNFTDYFTKPKEDIDELTDATGFSNPADLIARNKALQLDSDANNTVTQIFSHLNFDDEFKALVPIKNFKTSIGDTVFDKISELVSITGFNIYRDGGDIHIGDRVKLRSTYRWWYDIRCLKHHGASNVYSSVISSSFSDDISNRYSSIQISSQSEKEYGSNKYVIDTKTARDNTLPSPKYYAQLSNIKDDASGSIMGPEKIAIKIREQQRRDSFQLSYVVNGHLAANGQPWVVNRQVFVMDEVNDIRAYYVVYGVNYLYNKNSGHTTGLIISHTENNQLEI